ncbi:HU family DNA-binding protein [Desulfobulbus rhabdoformis]|jgi:DNA-binding protein HU-beta|uniref:HU family DNA-binding protein n=1 Tax=Desulfobulbus rhabdoformis TaxID=34032 RepID=UPI00196622DD|nr:HU family DNA-binding protein [Desulfobulbus rhabdoformis]MBM9616018.1 HU family DNA-binding protein [Desulfobulbus rhabdoformis]
MNKADLIEKVAKDCDMTKALTEQVLNSILNTITDAVAAGDKVSLIGFGTFSVNNRAARLGRNPQTGESIQIPARKVVKFKAGTKLIDSANI